MPGPCLGVESNVERRLVVHVGWLVGREMPPHLPIPAVGPPPNLVRLSTDAPHQLVENVVTYGARHLRDRGAVSRVNVFVGRPIQNIVKNYAGGRDTGGIPNFLEYIHIGIPDIASSPNIFRRDYHGDTAHLFGEHDAALGIELKSPSLVGRRRGPDSPVAPVTPLDFLDVTSGP